MSGAACKVVGLTPERGCADLVEQAVRLLSEARRVAVDELMSGTSYQALAGAQASASLALRIVRGQS